MKANNDIIIKPDIPSDIDYIYTKSCMCFGLDKKEVQRKTRKREIVSVRQVIHSLCKRLTKHSLVIIGYYIGNKDHATVLHSSKTVNNLIDTNKEFSEIYGKLCDKIVNHMKVYEDNIEGCLKKLRNINKELERLEIKKKDLIEKIRLNYKNQ